MPEDGHKLPFFHYDFALVKIDKPGSHSIICLPGPKILNNINDVKLKGEITIVGLGEQKKNDEKNLWKRKLQFAKMRRLDDINCWKQWYPKNQLPKDFSKIQNKGFCVKGSKKKIIICKGDSGSPAIWRNIKNKKDYVIGIAYESANALMCYDDPKNRKPADKYGAVPGVIFKWIREKGGKEVEEHLKKC